MAEELEAPSQESACHTLLQPGPCIKLVTEALTHLQLAVSSDTQIIFCSSCAQLVAFN